MEQQSRFLPEGSLLGSPQNTAAIGSEAGLREAIATGQRLEARVRVCDGGHNLHVDLPCMQGLIPRAEGARGLQEGAKRDIALISRVNKPVCFSVLSLPLWFIIRIIPSHFKPFRRFGRDLKITAR